MRRLASRTGVSLSPFQVAHICRDSSTTNFKCNQNLQKYQTRSLCKNSKNSWEMDWAKINEQRRMVEIKFQREELPMSYPFVWLRDCCQCEDCFHPDSKARMILLEDLDLDVKPKTVNVSMKFCPFLAFTFSVHLDRLMFACMPCGNRYI